MVDVSPPPRPRRGVASTPLRGPKMPLTAAKLPRLAPPPHFNRLFRGLMSLRRRSHWPADVIPHVWRCHCRPERTLSKSVHCLRPVEGRSATDSACPRPDLRLPDKTQTPVHPQYCMKGAEKKRACKGSHTCAAPWEVLSRVAIVHSLLREQRPEESRQTAER